MQLTRRHAISSIIYPAGFLALGGTAALLRPARAAAIAAEIAQGNADPTAVAADESLWARIQTAFTQDRSLVNLNNGGVSPAPAAVQEAHRRHWEYANSAPPPEALWRIQQPQKEGVRQRMARHWGVDPEEIALVRNSSEALQICQFGHDLQRGDEILTTDQDYPRMLNTFRQRERREGVVLKTIKIPVPSEDDDGFVRRFEAGITDRTRLILMCHIINITGQILPVKRVVEMARKRGIPVIVDGAHALAHFSFKLSDLDCDFYGVSLHKWLFAPHGTGLLYVRRDKIKGLWPLMAAAAEQDDNIRKFEEFGTHPVAPFLAIGDALTFHEAIGDERKEARLRYLRDTWLRLLGESPVRDRIRLHTPLSPAHSCGIATVQIDGLDSATLSSTLWDKHRILVTAIKHEDLEGIRVTPSVYTSIEDLERFADAVVRAAAR